VTTSEWVISSSVGHESAHLSVTGITGAATIEAYIFVA
jgi:hypothetical protein